MLTALPQIDDEQNVATWRRIIDLTTHSDTITCRQYYPTVCTQTVIFDLTEMLL
jgi:hypothetical protein